jgi:hypothetical protein
MMKIYSTMQGALLEEVLIKRILNFAGGEQYGEK